MLDDSLIHLRYAHNLLRYHFVTYDGLHHTFGTSSPLYLVLLTAVSAVWHSVLVAKAVSVVVYVLLFSVTAAIALRDRNTWLSRGLAFSLVVILSSPMGVRWLADGMESGLVCLSTFLLGCLAYRVSEKEFDLRWAALFFVYGGLLTLLRLELFVLCGVSSVALLLARRHRFRETWSRTIGVSVPLLMGSAVALLTVRMIFGSLLPDTALAKSSSHASIGIGVFFHLMTGAFLLGLGTLLLWFVTLFLAFRLPGRHGTPALLAINAMFPLLVVLAGVRGQAVQGVRYFLWAMFFSIAWNLLVLAEPHEETSRPGYGAPILIMIAVLFTALLLPDCYYAARTMQGRSHTFVQMRSEHLDKLSGRLMLADDIGFIGYFTNANICDLNGLVNGRAFAALTQSQRIQACIARHPEAMFLTRGRVAMMQAYVPDFREQWTACQRIDFPNVRTNDTHYILVRNEDVARLCPSEASPVPVGEILSSSKS